MAYLWMEDNDGWAALPLSETRYSLGISVARPGALACWEGLVPGRRALLSRTTADGQAERWAVIDAVDRLQINGIPLHSGIRVLRDRDAIRLERAPRAFFSAESSPRIEPFPGTEAVSCPRCHCPIEPGQDAVRCPNCGIWHHEFTDPDKKRDWKCWTYGPTCAQCGKQETAFDAGPRWTPEEL